jgi:hypothetical protein
VRVVEQTYFTKTAAILLKRQSDKGPVDPQVIHLGFSLCPVPIYSHSLATR